MAGIAVFSHRCTEWSSTPSDRFPKASMRDSGIGYAGLPPPSKTNGGSGSHVTQRRRKGDSNLYGAFPVKPDLDSRTGFRRAEWQKC
jgi:hypothetical protein